MNEPQTAKLKPLLESLVEESGAMTAMLITKEGQNITDAGNLTTLNTTALAALVAGMFSATREVARMVGERQFSILLQQGENRHIHISLVTDSAMMVVIFEDYQRIGQVRHQARKTGERLAPLLAEALDPQRVGTELSVPNFREVALNLIDRIFGST